MTTTSKPEILYKIQRKSDGLFSKGGSEPEFSKVGKVWRRKGDLSSHLTLIVDTRAANKNVYNDCEIIELHVVEASRQPVVEMMVATARRRHQEELDRKAKLDKQAKEQRRKEYQRLKKEFG